MSDLEPIAWMFPDDLEKFKTAETFGNAYSISVGSPDKGSTEPLYSAKQVQQLQSDLREMAEALMSKARGECRCVEGYPHTFGYSKDCEYYPIIQKAKAILKEEK